MAGEMGRTFLLAVLAGLSIGIGGTVYLSVEDPVTGALLFAVGLFCVCVFGFSLFTGKVCYAFRRPEDGSGRRFDRAYCLALPVIWLGNLAGAAGLGLLESLTRFGPALQARAAVICAAKLGQSPLSAFVLAVLCNVMIYIAVEGYRTIPDALGKYAAILFGVMVFILCGFEHCVANMYYFTAGAAWDGHAILYLLLMTLGNAAGGVLIPALRTLAKPKGK